MIPTTKLRFVDRVIAVPATDGVGRTVRILQQWWEDSDPEIVEEAYNIKLLRVEGEWRDVPLENEK